jgi:hypothetical protein
MKIYAQLNENNICTGISQLSEEVIQDNLIEIPLLDISYMWKKFENGAWSTETFEPISTAPISEFDQLKIDNTNLKEQLAQTNADMQGLMDYLGQQGLI